ncbi:MAG: acyclic terpene utilization AtuA family protein [Chitinophagales bacterium]
MNSDKIVRIAGTQGFYGDSPMGAMAIVMNQAADYLMHDSLAELTLSILQKDKMRDPSLGYPRDIELHAKILFPATIKSGIKVVTDSGGLNPEAAAEKVKSILQAQGITGAKIAIVTGDNKIDELKELKEKGLLSNMDSGEEFSFDKTPTHANVYIGAQGIKDALDQGADIILAGRVADPCLMLGILAHEFSWTIEGDNLSQEQLDLLASGIAAGHVLECGGQASGGNAYSEWPMDYSIHDLGYPIAHVSSDGSTVFTKLENQGGKMSRNTVREQLVYEIHDPANYLTPDVTVDLTQIKLEEIEPNKVRLTNVKGKPKPEKLKMTIGQMEGYLSEQFFFFSWPYAWDKIKKFEEGVRGIWKRLPYQVKDFEFQYIGVDAIHRSAAPCPSDEELNNRNELGLRIVIRHEDQRTSQAAFSSIICLGLNGPPGVNAMPGWGKPNRVMLGLWPTLIPRNLVNPVTKIIEV